MSVYCPYKDGPALYLDCKDCDKKICNAFFCLVVGSRTFSDFDFLKKKLDHLLSNYSPNVIIVSGGAKGADTLAERYANEKGYEKMIFYADWKKFGNQAGYIRNRQMHEFISKQKNRGVVAFWDGKSNGTKHSFSLAKEFYNPLKVIRF